MASASLDWLPYVDAQVSDAEYAAAKALITSEVDPASSSAASHPSMRPMPSLKPTALGADLIERASRGERLKAVDMSRYEGGALEAPTTDPSDPQHLQRWQEAVERAATLYSYLNLRGDGLALLETFGKNQWLIGNDRAEQDLKSLEKVLAQTKEMLEQTEQQRRSSQEAQKAELDALALEWRKRIAAKVQTEIATAELKEQIALSREA